MGHEEDILHGLCRPRNIGVSKIKLGDSEKMDSLRRHKAEGVREVIEEIGAKCFTPEELPQILSSTRSRWIQENVSVSANAHVAQTALSRRSGFAAASVPTISPIH